MEPMKRTGFARPYREGVATAHSYPPSNEYGSDKSNMVPAMAAPPFHHDNFIAGPQSLNSAVLNCSFNIALLYLGKAGLSKYYLG
jgi:hypothetical protein